MEHHDLGRKLRERSPRELQQKLGRLGIEVPAERFYTSAPATAAFLAAQSPSCSVYAIGESGLINALYEAGLSINDVDPAYVVIGDRMDTDIIAGLEPEIDSILLLSGVTHEDELPTFPYRPNYVLEGIGDIQRTVGAA